MILDGQKSDRTSQGSAVDQGSGPCSFPPQPIGIFSARRGPFAGKLSQFERRTSDKHPGVLRRNRRLVTNSSSKGADSIADCHVERVPHGAR